MPGNPLPTIEINASRWPYDENGPVNGKFGEVAVTPAPKAFFDASNGDELGGITGIVQWNNIDLARSYNTEIPHMPGQRGIRVEYPARNPFQNNAGNELNYQLLVHQSHVWEYVKIAQPVNFFMPREMQLRPADMADVQEWEAGDILEAETIGSGNTGTVYMIDYDSSYGEPEIIVTDFLGHPELRWASNKTVHNLTKGTSAVMIDGGWNANNGKHLHLWVSDEPLDEGRGYENGNYALEINQLVDDNPASFDHNGMAKIGGQGADWGTPTQNYAGSQKTSPTPIYDRQDNGEIVELVIERKRSSGFIPEEQSATRDGICAIWKKVSRAGSPNEEWTEIYRSETVTLYSSHYENKWTHGYLFGNKNAGYRESTTFYLMQYQLWTQKPTFLTEAGV